MKKLQSVLALCAFLAITAVATTGFSADAAGKPGEQTRQMYKVNGQDKLGYLLFLPADYRKDASKKWPVNPFLHGSGESGDGTTQLDKVKIHGPPKLAEQQKDFQFIVVSPQNPNPRDN